MQAAQNSGNSPNGAEVATAIAAVVAALGVFLVAIQVGQAKKSRHADIAADMSRRWDENELVESRINCQKYKDPEQFAAAVWQFRLKAHPDYFTLCREANFFEELGVLYKVGAISIKWIDLSLGSTVRARWRLWSAYRIYYDERIQAEMSDGRSERRPRPHRGTLYENFEALAKRIEWRRNGGLLGWLGVNPGEADPAGGRVGDLCASVAPNPSLIWWILPFSRSTQRR